MKPPIHHPAANRSWPQLTVKEVLSQLNSSADGLTSQQAAARLAQGEKNLLPAGQRRTWQKILANQFSGLLFYVLLIAAIINAILSEWLDFGVIAAVLLLSVLIGFMEEAKAARTLSRLKQILTPKATVYRDGRSQEILAAELVKGDVVILIAGEKIPADVRLLSTQEFSVDESLLTGESEAQDKNIAALPVGTVLADQTNMAFMGSVAVSGKARGLVVAIGQETALGAIAGLLQAAEENASPLQQKLGKFSSWLSIVVTILSFLVFIISWQRGNTFAESFKVAIAVMVAALPEAILAVVTVILAIGMKNILRSSGLVRHLLAAETLGSTTVICTDKTGTLTTGKMLVSNLLLPHSTKGDFQQVRLLRKQNIKIEEKVLLAAALCNDAYVINPQFPRSEWQIAGKGTERSLLQLAVDNQLAIKGISQQYPRLAEIPFTSLRGWMLTKHSLDNRWCYFVKGKPEKILEMCQSYYWQGQNYSLSKADKLKLQQQYELAAASGQRILALAWQEQSKKNSDAMPISGFSLLAIVGIQDVLREEAKQAAQELNSAGIKVIIATGDHALIAQHIAAELGWLVKSEEILTGDKLAKLSVSELTAKIEKYKIFARVTPVDKLKIIQAWQANGEVVAMTGDGVNDAPALKQADIGVALGSGTEVAKEAADLVLLDDNFATIAAAVREGRIIFSNIRKTFIYLLSGSLNVLLVIFGSIFLGWPLPLLPLQILWINLIADGLPDVSLAYEPAESDIMHQPPRLPSEPILRRRDTCFIAVISFLLAVITLSVFGLTWRLSNDLTLARTLTFVSFAINSVVYVLAIRSWGQYFWQWRPWKNKVLTISLLYGIILQLIVIYLPSLQKVFQVTVLSRSAWLIIAAVGFLALFLIEFVKIVFRLAEKEKKLYNI